MRIKICTNWESNPDQTIGNRPFYHLTISAFVLAGNRTLISTLATSYSTTKLQVHKSRLTGLNRRPKDLQSFALPTELSRDYIAARGIILQNQIKFFAVP